MKTEFELPKGCAVAVFGVFLLVAVPIYVVAIGHLWTSEEGELTELFLASAPLLAPLILCVAFVLVSLVMDLLTYLFRILLGKKRSHAFDRTFFTIAAAWEDQKPLIIIVLAAALIFAAGVVYGEFVVSKL